ncbi:hypothetical protein EYC80_010250 [Monilinia laxa]|uniref:F-box domain-containing protein n=1 Tax=Monilinia laxa TaxID=61186 RepID=A0A5N6JN66_MONLA|nr:hypothetical protein EYC80_010250 [Monilinia laxa]
MLTWVPPAIRGHTIREFQGFLKSLLLADQSLFMVSYITMPRPVRKATVKTTKSELYTKKKDIVKTNKKVSQPEGDKTVVASPIDRIYKTITLENDDIENGLWMLRKLGNGKYEVVNIGNVTYEDISSEENEARMASTPESVEVFRASQRSLNNVTAKLDRAVFTASGKVFRFKKLPIELRYKIYEFALISNPGTSLYPEHSTRNEPRLAFGLLATCRSVNAECKKFLWKNTFALSIPSLRTLRIDKQILIQNIRHVKCSWTGSFTKDVFLFGMLASCPNIETLEIELHPRCLERANGFVHYSRKPQFLHQDDISIQKFSRCNGFDKLISLQHLKKVVVSRTYNFVSLISSGVITEAEVKTFEKFLRKKLTTRPPLAPPMTLNHLPSTPTRQSTRIRKLKGAKPVKYVPDPVSDDEEDILDDEPHTVDDDNEEFGENVMSIAYLTQ